MHRAAEGAAQARFSQICLQPLQCPCPTVRLASAQDVPLTALKPGTARPTAAARNALWPFLLQGSRCRAEGSRARRGGRAAGWSGTGWIPNGARTQHPPERPSSSSSTLQTRQNREVLFFGQGKPERGRADRRSRASEEQQPSCSAEEENGKPPPPASQIRQGILLSLSPQTRGLAIYFSSKQNPGF